MLAFLKKGYLVGPGMHLAPLAPSHLGAPSSCLADPLTGGRGGRGVLSEIFFRPGHPKNLTRVTILMFAEGQKFLMGGRIDILSKNFLYK